MGLAPSVKTHFPFQLPIFIIKCIEMADATNTDLITGVILAGGKSRRMGKDKATLKINSTYLIEYPIKTLKRHFNDVIVVTNTILSLKLKEILSPTIRIYKDIYPNHGALGGIYTALFYSDTPYIFATACDMPFLNDGLIEYMIEQINGNEIVIPRGSKGYEALHAIYKKSLLDRILRNILNDENKIRNIFQDTQVLTIPAAVIKRYDENENMFININTPQELKRIFE